ncbi:hypothetical protein J5J10_05690 [Ciceribacter sp. L1K23]|uniref:hypothetical protein n=1 Tax=unclassified Ciceribacter TaxID=2628820 RepID=UPI001ABE90C5|nr:MULTISPECIES: hypothetical protein [unclassified Ciceribacter]MBO3760775.1 hypothetical protein [Ciceribacter sp. L1K22]MBR0555169.1 hypothetical protein [Ciceribacter sp. L1K23]
MNKPIILSAATSLFVTAAILLAAQSASEAHSSIPAMETITLQKTVRLPVAPNEEWDEAASEWALDCYDQFGPEGSDPNTTSLDSCLMPS